MLNLCRSVGVETHEFLPHYVIVIEFLPGLDTRELDGLRKNMVHALLRRRKSENARFSGKYLSVIFDATGRSIFPQGTAQLSEKSGKQGDKGSPISAVFAVPLLKNLKE